MEKSAVGITGVGAATPLGSDFATFAANLLNPVKVKDGALSIGVNQFSTGANPNSFETLVLLDTPYVYQGGDLVMLFRHSGSDSSIASPFLDAVNTTDPAYGIDFRAFSSNSLTAPSGIASGVMLVVALCSLTIYAADALWPRGSQAAFFFIVVPPGSWLLSAIAIAMAALSARMSGRSSCV